MYCEFCGKPVSDYAKFCRACGAKLEYYKTEPRLVAADPPAPEAPDAEEDDENHA